MAATPAFHFTEQKHIVIHGVAFGRKEKSSLITANNFLEYSTEHDTGHFEKARC